MNSLAEFCSSIRTHVVLVKVDRIIKLDMLVRRSIRTLHFEHSALQHRQFRQARSEIRLGICNFSDPEIGDPLAAAVARGVNVELIADQVDDSQKPDEQAELTTLIGEGVSVHLRNSVFPLEL
jgi:phosphatidylserine/phosphatidylglycerophosphate/cardiolipin synthase-like enzyme